MASSISVGSSNDANAIIDFNNNFIDSYKNASIVSIVKYADAGVIKVKGGNVLVIPMGVMDYFLVKLKEFRQDLVKIKKV